MTLAVMGLFLFAEADGSNHGEKAEAYFQRARTYESRDDIQGRMLARRYYQKAIDRDPDNVKYLSALADLWNASGFPENAKSLHRRILELEPGKVESHLRLAEIYSADMNYYQDMYAEEGRISFERFSRDDSEKALYHYRSVMELNPDHIDALKGMALYYLRKDDPGELAWFGQRLVSLEPDNPDGYLITGIGLAGKGDFGEAERVYRQALLKLSPGQRNAYYSLASVLAPREGERYRRFDPEARGRYEAAYWKRWDPLHLTRYNERELVHFTRIACADLLFKDPGKGLRGWETDRGRVYVRYGRPAGVFKSWTEFDEGWYYPDFSLRFEDYFRSGKYRFAWSGYSDPLDSDWMRFEAIVRDRPTYHYVDFRGRRFAFPYIVSTFKDREPDKTLMEISFGVPLTRLVVADSTGEVRIREGVFVFDRNYQPIAESVRDKEFNLPYDFRPQPDQYLIDQELISLPPGSYVLAVEVADRNGLAFGSSHVPRDVVSYRADGLRISDLTLASKVFKGKGITFYRQDLAVHPNPLMEFHRPEGLAAYFGVYNLTLGPDGRSRYRITTRVTGIRERGRIRRTVDWVIGGGREEGLSISSDYSGLFADEMRVLTVDLENLKPGKYQMEIKVEDRLTGVVQSSRRVFRLLD